MQTLAIDRLVGQTLGNYRVERLLGKGRLNAVYLARHLPTQRTDALTLYLVPEQFSPEACQRFLARFLKESAAIATLNHPHVLPIYASGDLQGYPYLVTPYMMHGSLADIVKQKKRCDYPYVQSVLEQITSGIAFAHSQGFIHGTLKPANIVLQSEDNMQVAGFGLMHMLQISGIEHADQQYAHLLSIAGTFLAAPEYIAPEVVQGKSIDARSDVYAIGCILYELLSGTPPFTGSNPLDIVDMHVTQPLPSLRKACPDLPAAIISVVNQALEREPQRRFQHVNELAEAFSQATRGAQGPVVAVAPPRAAVERVQDAAHDEALSTNWQLMPPIVTGKVPAINVASARPAGLEAPTLVNTDAWQTSTPATGRVPAASRNSWQAAPTATKGPVPAPPTLVNNDGWQPPARSTTGRVLAVQPVTQKKAEPVAPQPIQREPQPVAPQPAPPDAQGADADLAQAYSWWSQPGLVAAPPQVKQNRPAAGPPVPAAKDPLRLPPPTVDWTTDAPMPMSSMNRQSSQQRPRKLKRRYVVASMVTGVAAIAVTGTAFALNFKQPGTTPQAPAVAAVQNNNPASQNTQAPAPAQPPPATQPQPAAAAPTGNVVGKMAQAQNTAVTFTNPADNAKSLLVHLPSGKFVAYESACTHEGVTVNYDPATSTFICPAHGAIFDPANGGKVLQGPAMKPIPSVAVHVNADGTVTAV